MEKDHRLVSSLDDAAEWTSCQWIWKIERPGTVESKACLVQFKDVEQVDVTRGLAAQEQNCQVPTLRRAAVASCPVKDALGVEINERLNERIIPCIVTLLQAMEATQQRYVWRNQATCIAMLFCSPLIVHFCPLAACGQSWAWLMQRVSCIRMFPGCRVQVSELLLQGHIKDAAPSLTLMTFRLGFES